MSWFEFVDQITSLERCLQQRAVIDGGLQQKNSESEGAGNLLKQQ